MAGVNLRVATLKDANMQNCDLRSAVLAGADLEVNMIIGPVQYDFNKNQKNLEIKWKIFVTTILVPLLTALE